MRKTLRSFLLLVMILPLLCIHAQAESTWDESLLMLASPSAPLPAGYVPQPLMPVRTDMPGMNWAVYRPTLLREEALEALYALMQAADQAGQPLYLRQAYRSYTEEERRYEVMTSLGQQANKPGESDYQTGLAVTLVGEKWRTSELTTDFASSAESEWLASHAAEYGFVQRYPEDKESATGWPWEPWHYRYVGPDAATTMAEQGLCLEEFVDSIGLTGELPEALIPPETTPKPELTQGPVNIVPVTTPIPERTSHPPIIEADHSVTPEPTHVPTEEPTPAPTSIDAEALIPKNHGVPPRTNPERDGTGELGLDGDYELSLFGHSE